MSKYIKIDKDTNIKCNKEVKEFLNPDYIYIPFYNNYELLIKNHDKVTMNDKLLQKDDNIYYSTVSGTIVGITNMLVDNKNMKCIVIENDFMENDKITNCIKNITNISKKDLITKIKRLNAFNGNLNGNILLISGIDYEPYEESLSKLLYKYTEDILECIDALIKILNIKKCVLVIKNTDTTNVNNLLNQIGTYPNIELKLVPDVYPLGKKEVICNELFPHLEPIYLTINDVYNIYNILRKNKPVNNHYVTFSGDKLTKSKVINCKIGTNIKEIIDKEFKIKDDNYHLVINGLLSGYEVNDLNTIITQNIRSVFLTSSITQKPKECINCGLCLKYCPAGVNPKTNYNKDKCINCGLCSYICPSKINLRGKHE